MAWVKSRTTLGAGITMSFEPSDDLLALVAALWTGNLDSFFLEHGGEMGLPPYPNVLSKTKETPPRCNRGNKQGGAV